MGMRMLVQYGTEMPWSDYVTKSNLSVRPSEKQIHHVYNCFCIGWGGGGNNGAQIVRNVTFFPRIAWNALLMTKVSANFGSEAARLDKYSALVCCDCFLDEQRSWTYVSEASRTQEPSILAPVFATVAVTSIHSTRSPIMRTDASDTGWLELELFNIRIWRILTMLYNTQNYWICGLCPSSRILNTSNYCF
jgi:hypothetical protein